MYKIQLIRLGNHWYPDLNHNYPSELVLDSKFEKILNYINKNPWYFPTVYLYEVGAIMPEKGVIDFNDEDLERYLNTEDSFNLRITIDNRSYLISSELCHVLEDNFNLELSKAVYKIEIW